MEDFNLNALIDQEVENRIQDKITELNNVKKINTELRKTNTKLIEENKTVQKIMDQLNEFQAFKPMINKNNIDALFNLFGLEKSNEIISGMDSENIPDTFKLLWKYYPSRNIVIDMFDFFNIEYDEHIKDYRMPYDLSKDEIILFIKNTSKAYVTNGCIFDYNTGFFYRDLKVNKYKTENVITKGDGWSSYIAMPWQLILKSKYFEDSDILDLVIETIKKKSSNSSYYYRLPAYHTLPDNILKEMTMLLPISKLYDDHKIFLEFNKNILNQSKDIADRFCDSINDNHYSSFYYCRFPEEYQIDFIKRQTHFPTVIDMIKKSTISYEKKQELLIELCTKQIA